SAHCSTELLIGRVAKLLEEDIARSAAHDFDESRVGPIDVRQRTSCNEVCGPIAVDVVKCGERLAQVVLGSLPAQPVQLMTRPTTEDLHQTNAREAQDREKRCSNDEVVHAVPAEVTQSSDREAETRTTRVVVDRVAAGADYEALVVFRADDHITLAVGI